jgi:hypothetical protein
VAQGRIAKRRDNIGGARQRSHKKRQHRLRKAAQAAKRVAVEARDAVDVEQECRGASGAAVSVGARITRVILAQQICWLINY